MIKSVSDDIAVTVVTRYQEEQSNPLRSSYMFAYQITISNHSHVPVQLCSRQWIIKESNGKQTMVNGEGVVGKTPVIYPGEEFSYVSCCPLECSIGTMEGMYQFVRLDNNQTFHAPIPRFHLVCKDLMN